jgi:hypothetical protein
LLLRLSFGRGWLQLRFGFSCGSTVVATQLWLRAQQRLRLHFLFEFALASNLTVSRAMSIFQPARLPADAVARST